MTHQVGTHLGGVRTVDDLRERCVLADDGSECWHLRSPRGKSARVVWVHGVGTLVATRAAWYVARGQLLPPGPSTTVVYRTCGTPDCVNPEHLRCGSRATHGRVLAKSGRLKGTRAELAAQLAATKRTHNRKLTPELAAWARESTQSARAAAHALGIATSGVIDIRAGKAWTRALAASSVFAWAKAA